MSMDRLYAAVDEEERKKEMRQKTEELFGTLIIIE